jgi:hypothetical protein
MGNGHLQRPSARLDPKRDPRRPLVLTNRQRHGPAGDVERSRLGRGWFPNGSAGFGKKGKHHSILYDSSGNLAKKNRHLAMPVILESAAVTKRSSHGV